MTLAARIATDAGGVFLNSDHFAETVTYYPHRFGTAATPREIKAVVVRNQVATFNPDEQIVVRIGETATRRSIQYLTEHDDGMLVLICR
jgi:hypothetical protein